jgi:hypothetical protein
MKLKHMFLIGLVACAITACEKQPYGKTESILATEKVQAQPGK